jgi:glycine oxidase
MPDLKNTQETADAVVVGGGVIGLAVARALARRGAGRVLLLERGALGAEASRAAGGMLAPQAEADEADAFLALACAGRDAYPEFAEKLLDETGVDIEFDRTGTLYLALTEADERALQRRYEWQTEAGLSVERLTGAAARELEPCVAPDTRAALRFPRDWQADNRLLCLGLAESCRRLGVEIRSSTAAQEVFHSGGKIAGVRTAETIISAPVVVLAAGAWTSKLLPSLEITPVRGQMLCFQSAPATLRHVVYTARGYLVPRRDGRLLTGSTTEHAGFDKDLTLKGLQAVTRNALEIAPALSDLPLREAWAGLRPRAADGLPVIGADAKIAGLFHATGHYRNGILLAPLTGELLAETIVNQEAAPLLAAFSPARFARRAQPAKM